MKLTVWENCEQNISVLLVFVATKYLLTINSISNDFLTNVIACFDLRAHAKSKYCNNNNGNGNGYSARKTFFQLNC